MHWHRATALPHLRVRRLCDRVPRPPTGRPDRACRFRSTSRGLGMREGVSLRRPSRSTFDLRRVASFRRRGGSRAPAARRHCLARPIFAARSQLLRDFSEPRAPDEASFRARTGRLRRSVRQVASRERTPPHICVGRKPPAFHLAARPRPAPRRTVLQQERESVVAWSLDQSLFVSAFNCWISAARQSESERRVVTASIYSLPPP